MVLAGTACLTMSLITAGAAVIFNENFDNTPPYSDGGNVPVGLNTINLGSWGKSGTGTAITTTSTSLSATRSLELANTPVVLGAYFGTDNSGNITTTDPLSVRFAFNLTSTSATDVYVRTQDHATIGLIQFSGSGKYLRIQNAGTGWNTSISVDLNTWYYAELNMPGDPGGSGTIYSMKVYESDGTTQHGITTSGNFTTTLASQKSYRYVNFASNSAASVTYFDNISVQTVPEPTVTGLFIGGGICLALKRRFGCRSRRN